MGVEVSVVCIAFNHGEYIADALEGFINQQTDFTYEVIVHDDASTDGTQEIIREYADRYPDIIVPILQGENQFSLGKKVFRDYIRPLVRGRYIAWCEGDDCWIDEGKLQKQFDFLESHPDYSLCLHNALVMDYRSGISFLSEAARHDVDKSFSRLVLEGGGRINPTASFFYRLDSDCGFRYSLRAPVGDHFLLMELASQGKVRWMSDSMSVYRLYAKGSWSQRDASRSHALIREYTDSYVRSLEKFNEHTDFIADESFQSRISMQKRVGWERETVAGYLNGDVTVFESSFRSLPAAKKLKALVRKHAPRTLEDWLIRRKAIQKARASGTLVACGILDKAELRRLAS